MTLHVYITNCDTGNSMNIHKNRSHFAQKELFRLIFNHCDTKAFKYILIYYITKLVMGGPQKDRLGCTLYALLRASVLGDGFGALTDCVLGQFSWKQQSNSSLDFPAADG